MTRVFRSLPDPFPLRIRLPLCAPHDRNRPAFGRGRPAGSSVRVLVIAVATHYPEGNCVESQRETRRGSHSAWTRFLIAPGRTVPDSWVNRPGTTPAGGTGETCLRDPVSSVPQGMAIPVVAILSPVARDYPSRVLDGFFMPSHRGCSLKEHGEDSRSRPKPLAVPWQTLGQNCAASGQRPRPRSFCLHFLNTPGPRTAPRSSLTGSRSSARRGGSTPCCRRARAWPGCGRGGHPPSWC